ncbi:efflux RND transporter periplasmic adaptor subunit [Candidatus Daviesbacteria bacterium]|nr:efflux RND transporter periplasmic adaptor subunit [Candidatus Daviesbacteria bacterium]
MKIPHILRLGKKRIIVLVAIIAIAILTFNLFANPKQLPLQFTAVKRTDISETVSSSGILTGKRVVNLRFKSAGKLAYLNVKAGDKVTAYQTIAGLDTKLLAIDLQQTQNTLRDKQAIAEKVEDDVKDHAKDETFKQKADRTTAQAARDSAYDSVKKAQEALNEANIYTPIRGIVTQVPVTIDQYVSSSDLIAQIVDTSEVFFDTDVDEVDIDKVSLGQKALIILDAYSGKTFDGEVFQIIPQTKTTSSGATVVTVRIKIDEPKLTFINGLSGQASIIVSEAKEALTIPAEALREDSTVFVQTNGNLNLKKVNPGIQSDTDIEIKEGLEENEKVLLNPSASSNVFNRNQNSLGGIFRLFGGGRGR